MKKYLPIIIICLVAIALRVGWWSYTNYTAEDSHITYQFAKQVHAGNGFVFNTGERIYGTTTPLFTLLLAGWLFVSSDIVLGSKLLGLAASLGGLVFLYFSFREERTAIIAVSVLAISMKLIVEDMAGMETSFLLLFMMGAIWGYAKDRHYFAGVMCGLLLWTRIDSAVFVAVLALTYIAQSKPIFKFLAGTLVYLPWVIFATLYFGSPVPFTITAKTVAYGTGLADPLKHAGKIVDYITIPVLALTAIGIFYKRNPLLSWFFFATFLFLVASGTTFFDRYFYTLMVTALVIASVLASRVKNLFGVAFIVFLLSCFSWNSQVVDYKNLQVDRHNVLKNIGLWFRNNTQVDATIQLEPLGYIGYYADRTMLDEVGLITPQVVELKKQGVSGESMYPYLWTDYILLQCRQAENVMDDFSKEYAMVAMFENGYARSCYEIWKRL